MKTLCIMDSVSHANGGIFEAERRLQQCLQAQPGVQVQVVGLEDEHTPADLAKWLPLAPVVKPVRGPRAFGFAPGFLDRLLHTEADLAYAVGLWKYPSLAALRWSRRTGRPLIVAPHGMLDQWALRNSGFKKRLAGLLFQNAQLRHAVCIRALCEAEAQAIRNYGLTNPIAIIPNGIDLVESVARPAGRTGKHMLLFLSRIHPKKGLVNLLKAWAAARPATLGGAGSDWLLAIAGWDQDGHEAELKRLATDLGLAWTAANAAQPDAQTLLAQLPPATSVVFLGPQFNTAKTACYQGCDAFILPSFSEGLPMVVLEAWAHGKPVLMTAECNVPEGFAAHAAIRIETNAESIQAGLDCLFQAGPAALATMGGRGRDLVAARFIWPRVASDLRAVCEWVTGHGAKPACVI